MHHMSLESCAFTMQEQEIGIKCLMIMINKDVGIRVVTENVEYVKDTLHIISRCPKMSTRYYLLMRYDTVTKSYTMLYVGKIVLMSESKIYQN